MCNLIVLMGVPGSGKSTWAKSLFDLKYKVVSSDAIRKELAGSLKSAHNQQIKPWDEFYRRIEESLRFNVDTIADATFLLKKHRMRALEIAWRSDARTHLVVFKNLLEGSIRNAARETDLRVPDTVMADMISLYHSALPMIAQESWDTVTKIEGFS